MKFFFLFLITTLSHAQDWERAKENFNFMREDIVYSNRAHCAKTARLPTKTVFLLVDNVNIAKASFRLSKIRGIDPVQTTNLATKKFRYSITTLISMIAEKLISGKLPFVDDSKVTHDYLKYNWEKSGPVSANKLIKCQIVKKWGSLHSYLTVSKPDHLILEEMAKEMEKLDETFSECHDLSMVNSQEVDLFRFGLGDIHDFQKIGFEFWYSLKVYLSWAFRHSREMEQLAAPFDYLFRSSDLEEMILFISSGCESISRPECSEGQLNLDTLGMLTSPSDKFDFRESDRVRPLASAQTAEFFTKPLPLKEDDLLNLTKFETSEEWSVNFRNNFIKTRGFQKIRLRTSLTNLNVIQKVLTADELHEKISFEVNTSDENWKKDFFYLCSEYGVATNKHFTALGKDLEKLKLNKNLPEINKDLSLEDIDSAIELFLTLSPKLLSLCQTLEAKEFWRELNIDKKGFASWYLQVSRGEYASSIQPRSLTLLSGDSSFVKVYGTEVFCKSGVHCARILLDSLFGLSSLAKSFSTIIPQEISSSHLGNPYATHMACGAYDPWAKRNKMLYEFFHDLGQAFIFGFLPTPVYVSADLNMKKLVSFSELIKEGKVFYDPQYNPRSVSLSLVADLGPFVGVPCSISLTGGQLNPLEYYTFNGISFSSCMERSRHDLNVGEDNDLNSSSSTRSFCGSCAINLRTVSSSFASLNPVLRFSSFLLKAIVRLSKNLRDPDDLPKAWQVSPHKVALSYRYKGEIDKNCARKLRKGKSCLPLCQSEMMESFTGLYDVSPVSTSFNCFLGRGKVMVKECESPIYLSSSNDLKINTTCSLKRRAL